MNLENRNHSYRNLWINQLLRAEWLLVVLYFLVRPVFQNDVLNRMLWIPGILLLFVINVLQLIQTHRVKISFFVPAVILFSMILFGMIQFGAYRTAGQVYAVFSFVNMILLLVQMDRFRISIQTKNRIFRCNFFLVLLFLCYTQTELCHLVTEQGVTRYTRYFAFNLGNTNEAGMYLYCFFCLMLIGSPIKRFRFLHGGLLAVTFYMMYRTGSRTCILAASVVLVLSWIPWKRVPNLIVDACAIFPAVFIYAYLYLYYSGFENFTLTSADKSFFSGRQEIFVMYLNMLRGPGQMLFGNLGECTFDNAHNAPLAITCSVGIVGALCFLVIVLRRLHLSNRGSHSGVSVVAMSCILGIFIQSSGEASLLLGGFPTIPFVMAFFLMLLPAEGEQVPESQPAEREEDPENDQK